MGPLRLIFSGAACFDVIVGNGRRHDDEAGLLPAIEDRGAHLLRGFDEDGLGGSWRLQGRRAAYQNDLRSAPQGSFRKGISHFAAGAIAEIANGIDRLVRGAGGDQYGFAGKILGDAEALEGSCDDLFGIGKSSLANHATSEIAAARFDDVDTAVSQDLEVRLGRGMLPHIHVHGGRDDDGRGGRQIERAEEVVGNALRELRDNIGRSRRDQQAVDRLGNGDMLDRRIEIGVLS